MMSARVMWDTDYGESLQLLDFSSICEMPDRALYCRLLATSIQEKSELVPARNHAHGTVFIDVD